MPTYRFDPIVDRQEPTSKPTAFPSARPTTREPSAQPTKEPTSKPTNANPPTSPSQKPSDIPTPAPSKKPTDIPTGKPTNQPTKLPTKQPSKEPSAVPTKQPSKEPSAEPTKQPSKEPTKQPTSEPTKQPSKEPTKQPTAEPTKEPTMEPTKQPTSEPTKQPSKEPTKQPTAEPTKQPTPKPTGSPTKKPTDSASSKGPFCASKCMATVKVAHDFVTLQDDTVEAIFPVLDNDEGFDVHGNPAPLFFASVGIFGPQDSCIWSDDGQGLKFIKTEPGWLENTVRCHYSACVDDDGVPVCELANVEMEVLPTPHLNKHVMRSDDAGPVFSQTEIQYTPPDATFEGWDVCKYRACVGFNCRTALVFLDVQSTE
ncbi:hypothetical protein ACHAXT_003670 [Thalassiosira profunda]